MRRRAVALCALCCCAAAHAGLRPGNMPPDRLGSTIDGRDVSVPALRGQVVVISFWATWCGYCMKELPVLAGLQRVASQRHLACRSSRRITRRRVAPFARPPTRSRRVCPRCC